MSRKPPITASLLARMPLSDPDVLSWLQEYLIDAAVYHALAEWARIAGTLCALSHRGEERFLWLTAEDDRYAVIGKRNDDDAHYGIPRDTELPTVVVKQWQRDVIRSATEKRRLPE